MKAILKTLLFMFIVLMISQCRKEVEPPTVTIPDNNFLNALIELGVDTNGDGIISPEEAEVITYLNVSSDSIVDMTGIEAFINLDSLVCHYNKIKSLDFSNNTLLEYLDCDNNELTNLDVSNNTSLTKLYCSQNKLTSLDVSNNTSLINLICGFNQLTTLDVSNNTALIKLHCEYNQLTTLDVSNNTLLGALSCGSNELNTLDVSNNTSLEYLNCNDNELTTLDVSNNAALRMLRFWFMPSLTKVCVWEMPFPPFSVDLIIVDSPNVYFTTDCN